MKQTIPNLQENPKSLHQIVHYNDSITFHSYTIHNKIFIPMTPPPWWCTKPHAQYGQRGDKDRHPFAPTVV